MPTDAQPATEREFAAPEYVIAKPATSEVERADPGALLDSAAEQRAGVSALHRAPLLWLALPFMAGLAAGRLQPCLPAAIPLAVALAAATLSAWAAWRRAALWAPFLLLALTAAGAASTILHIRRQASWEDWPAREARLTLKVERVYPSAYPGRCAIVGVVIGAEPHLRDLLGQRIACALAKPKGAADPVRSARVAVVGLLAVVPLRPPAGTPAARFAALGLNFRLSRGHLLRIGPPDRYYGCLERLSARMSGLLRPGFERRPDLGAVYRAMMLGQKGDLTRGQREAFLRSGTMHLFAINGLHIDIVAVSVRAFLALLRCPAWGACGAVLGILWLDVSATSAPSAMRAFVMVGSAEAGRTLRRPRNPLSALSAAALLAVLAEPLDFFGASFQMSYGVVAVLFTFGLPLAGRLQNPRLRPRPSDPRWSALTPARLQTPGPSQRAGVSALHLFWASARRWLLGALAVGLAAALVSAVTGVEFFGLLVPGGLLANLAVAPLAMLVIVAGAASLGVGLAGWAAASRFCNGAAAVLLRLIQALISAGARLPASHFSAHYRAGWIGPAALAGLVLACLAGCATGWEPRRGGFWPPVVLVALALGLGARFGP